jgi:hypothetical protein
MASSKGRIGLVAAAFVAAGTLAVFGFVRASQRTGYERFIPSVTAAQETLETALNSWKTETPGSLLDLSPVVQFYDTERRTKRPLRDFEVLGEAPGDAPRCFAARLTLDNPPEEKRVRYVVVGNDPLWVMSYEDYEMVMHWNCPPPLNYPKPVVSR